MPSFNKIINWFQTQFKAIDQQTNLRERKIHTMDVFYLMCRMINKKYSYQEAVTEMRIDNLIRNVSAQAFNHRVTSGRYVQPFYQLIQKFTDNFITSDKHQHIYAVDGSKINLGLSMTKYGFSKCRNRPYATGLISVLYDIEHQTPIEYQLSHVLNERTLFYDQLMRLKMNNGKQEDTSRSSSDIFIFDRGYYSSEMMDKMNTLFQNFIFRIKNNLKIIKQLGSSGSDDMIIDSNGHKMRVVKYTIKTQDDISLKIGSTSKIKLQLKKPIPIPNQKEKTYYLVTSLLDNTQYPIDKLKQLYHRRWAVEEYYKKIKRNLISGTFHAHLLTSLETELLVQQMINLLTRYFLNTMYKNYPVNQKISNNMIIDKILPTIIYGLPNKINDEKINNILIILEKNTVPIRSGRSFERIKIFPVSKHIYQENKHPQTKNHYGTK